MVENAADVPAKDATPPLKLVWLSVSINRPVVASIVSSSNGPAPMFEGICQVELGNDGKVIAAEYCWLTIKMPVPTLGALAPDDVRRNASGFGAPAGALT